LIGFVANKPSPVTERPTRKEREDIARGIAANFYDVSSNQAKADVTESNRDVRYSPKRGHPSDNDLKD
jgi:hypothetical protein